MCVEDLLKVVLGDVCTGGRGCSRYEIENFYDTGTEKNFFFFFVNIHKKCYY